MWKFCKCKLFVKRIMDWKLKLMGTLKAGMISEFIICYLSMMDFTILLQNWNENV